MLESSDYNRIHIAQTGDFRYNIGIVFQGRAGVTSTHTTSNHERSTLSMATSDSITLKRCSKCGAEKPATREYFSTSKTSKSGLSGWCKKCFRKNMQKLRRSRGTKARSLSKIVNGQRKCTKCKKWYPNTSEYYPKSSRGKDGLYCQCKNCRPYGTSRVDRSNTFRVADWTRALAYFDNCCAVCGCQLNNPTRKIRAAADHWIAYSSPDSPGTVATNIVPLCDGVGGCNNSKHDREPLEWLASKFGKRKAAEINARIQAYFDYVKSLAVQS